MSEQKIEKPGDRLNGPILTVLQHETPWVDVAELSWDTRIVHDLGVKGDDFYEMLEWIHEIFHTDFREMIWTDYSSPEGDFLSNWFGRKRLIEQCKPMTLAALNEAIRQGRWIEKTPPLEKCPPSWKDTAKKLGMQILFALVGVVIFSIFEHAYMISH